MPPATITGEERSVFWLSVVRPLTLILRDGDRRGVCTQWRDFIETRHK